MSLTVVPDIFVLNIARWGVREFCIAIVAVNSASLRPSELPSSLRQPDAGRLMVSSVPPLLLDQQIPHTGGPAETPQLRLPICTASPTALQQITARRPSPQLDFSRRINHRQLHPARAWRAGIRLRGSGLPDDFAHPATRCSRLRCRRHRSGERRDVPHPHRQERQRDAETGRRAWEQGWKCEFRGHEVVAE